MGKDLITAVITAKNEESVIEDALKSITWCNHIIHIDNGSTDKTIPIVKKYKGKTYLTESDSFSERKNLALKQVKTSWVIYLDADERITPLLRSEILSVISEDSEHAAYEIPRRNIYLGKLMKHGGWGGDSVIRLFKTKKLKKWVGILHEQPELEGSTGKLINEIVHLSHRDLESMVEKTIIFTQKERDLRFETNHPPIYWWRFPRVMLTEFSLRFIKLKAWADREEGVIDGMFQIYNTFIIYARLWELQREKSSKKQ
jgi:(heptosyl)LPS beta-1,4-glucosyltransferase